jgi:hypothetical protein
MVSKKIENKISETVELDDQQYDDPQENLLGVFSILLAVAKRTNPGKYLDGYKKTND